MEIAYQEAFNTPVLQDFVTLVNNAEQLSLIPIEKNEKLLAYPLLAPRKKMLDFALQSKSTTHVVIMSIYAILLAKYSGKRDITFEEGIAGRNYSR